MSLTYYIWKDENKTNEEIELQANKYKSLGFKVVVYNQSNDINITSGISNIINNHI